MCLEISSIRLTSGSLNDVVGYSVSNQNTLICRNTVNLGTFVVLIGGVYKRRPIKAAQLLLEEDEVSLAIVSIVFPMSRPM